MKETVTITEYQSFVAKREGIPSPDGCVELDSKTFDALENFILANYDKDNEASSIMKLGVRKNRKALTAQKYVGVISMKNGTVIEIFPKIYSKDGKENGERLKKLFLRMLKALEKMPDSKSFQKANVAAQRMNVIEIFIRMFIDEITVISKCGLKCGYQTVERNEQFIKGKIDFGKNIKYNVGHKERCYVRYDEFNVNRPENRLIKSTLAYLLHISTHPKNKRDIKTLLDYFEEVDYSSNYEADFSKAVIDRNMKEYEHAIEWCNVFLSNKSFTSFSGSQVAYSLLFSMEDIFESYIANLIKKYLNSDDYAVAKQAKRHRKYLYDQSKDIKLKPDIVITRKSDNAVFILDTKWKVLSKDKGISNSDAYQMFAYHKRYKSKYVTLLYPLTEKSAGFDNSPLETKDGEVVKAVFLDLYADEKQIVENVIEDIRSFENMVAQ